jgi:hypothetical protein
MHNTRAYARAWTGARVRRVTFDAGEYYLPVTGFR